MLKLIVSLMLVCVFLLSLWGSRLVFAGFLLLFLWYERFVYDFTMVLYGPKLLVLGLLASSGSDWLT